MKKTQDAINVRKNSDQSKTGVGAITDGGALAEKPAAPETPPAKSGTSVANEASSIAPGVSAPTTEIQASAEASAAFRVFVNSAKITGVISQQGRTPLMTMNNKLVRAGDTVDATLGITFEGLDQEKKQIIFKDKNGAVVTRRY